MKTVKKIAIVVLAAVLTCAAAAVPIGVSVRGNLKNVELPENFKAQIGSAKTALADGANTRIMSANLLVHYESWGGTPAKPRAKMFMEVLDSYKPDVVGVQEISEEWYCSILKNANSYKFLYPASTGLFVNMTALIYNSDTLTLIDSGKMKFSEGDNPRLRRVVWGVFERKDDGSRFAVTSTHFDLIRENKEAAQMAIMETQTKEMIELSNTLAEKYGCPIFSTGDFNAMDNGSINPKLDAPEIYEKLSANLTDTKYVAEKSFCGNASGLDVPVYDHIFLNGNAEVKEYQLLSSDYIEPISDHFPIFIDVNVK